MDTPSSAGHHERRVTVLAQVSAETSEDPFGPGDPLQVARLVRRALAAAGHKATDVGALLVVADDAIPPDARSRFARRALGPPGAAVQTTSLVVPASDHDARRDLAMRSVRDLSTADGHVIVIVVVVLGPGERVTAVCGTPA